MEYFMKNNLKAKHLNIQDRLFIEECLTNWHNDSLNFQIIANSLAKDPTTISKEIKRNSTVIPPKSFNNGFNQCAKKYDCKKRHICNEYCKLKCSECIYCNKYCKDFEKIICPQLKRPPYVCNACPQQVKCKQEKRVYSSTTAQANRDLNVSESKSGLNIKLEDFLIYQETLKQGLLKGESFEHIIMANKDKIPYSVRSAYRHLKNGDFNDILPIDLRKVVKRKFKLNPKRMTQKELQAWRELKKGRNYEDFLDYISKNSTTEIVEMDTVIGKRDEGYCLLTFYFRKSHILIAYLLKEHTSDAVVEKIDEIYYGLGKTLFKKLFNVILTDNGAEFENVLGIERDRDNEKRCNLFFCDPSQSGQKGRLESGHRLIRYVYPKKVTSFEFSTQEDITLMYNHINNYLRRTLNGTSPMQIAKLLLPQKALEFFELIELEPNLVTLKPELVKH